MANLTLSIELGDDALKKLRAYAVLSGASSDDLESELSIMAAGMITSQVDAVLSKKILETLAQLDNKPIDAYSEKKQALVEPEPVDESIHSLSDDDDAEENKSLQEQYEAATKPQAALPQTKPEPQSEFAFDIDVPNAGDNAEAFLESFEEQPKSASSSSVGIYGAVRSAKSKFNPKQPRVSVTEYDPDGESSLFS
jgi:hypothetical protein